MTGFLRGLVDWKRFRGRILALIVGWSISAVLMGSGLFYSCEFANRDVLAEFNSLAAAPNTALVEITESDYEELFGGRSPLDPERLIQVVSAVTRARPAVVGVDLDTSELTFDLAKWMDRFAADVPVVWGERVTIEGETVVRRNLPFRGEHPVPSALTAFIEDVDGRVRSYQRVVDDVPSLAWKITSIACDRKDGATRCRINAPDTDGKLWLAAPPIDLAPDQYADRASPPDRSNIFLRMSASHVLELANDPSWETSSLLRDRVVIIGGLYAPYDVLPTSVGMQYGLDMQGLAVESEMQGRVRRSAAFSTVITAELGFAAAVMLLMTFFSHRAPWVSLLLAIVGLPIAALLWSWYFFASFSQWANATPIWISLVVHAVYEQTSEHSELLRRLKALERATSAGSSTPPS